MLHEGNGAAALDATGNSNVTVWGCCALAARVGANPVLRAAEQELQQHIQDVSMMCVTFQQNPLTKSAVGVGMQPGPCS
jgi:hypothetical protein